MTAYSTSNILGGDAHQHDEADQRRHGEALVRRQQRHKSAAQ
jgi:hypothetical protein